MRELRPNTRSLRALERGRAGCQLLTCTRLCGVHVRRYFTGSTTLNQIEKIVEMLGTPTVRSSPTARPTHLDPGIAAEMARVRTVAMALNLRPTRSFLSNRLSLGVSLTLCNQPPMQR